MIAHLSVNQNCADSIVKDLKRRPRRGMRPAEKLVQWLLLIAVVAGAGVKSMTSY